MKITKVLVVIGATICLHCSCFAQAKGEASTLVMRTTYYGEKASNGDNPCKGKTTRVCAIIETELFQRGTFISVSTSTKDRDGVILQRDSRIISGDVQHIIQETQASLPYNASLEVIEKASLED
ncbi:MAG: hypothetical protein K2I61_06395 [Muribaculaceae bacterium]|nr:hypothetical protein [Muribaculaceae bacterium]